MGRPVPVSPRFPWPNRDGCKRGHLKLPIAEGAENSAARGSGVISQDTRAVRALDFHLTILQSGNWHQAPASRQLLDTVPQGFHAVQPPDRGIDGDLTRSREIAFRVTFIPADHENTPVNAPSSPVDTRKGEGPITLPFKGKRPLNAELCNEEGKDEPPSTSGVFGQIQQAGHPPARCPRCPP